IAIMSPNILQYPIALMGALRAGLIVVNVNPLYTERELKHQLTDSGAEAIVIVANFAHTLEAVIEDTNVKHVILTELGDLLGFPKSLLVNSVVKYVKKMVPKFSLRQAYKFNDVLAEGSKLSFRPVKVESDDIAFLQYTGGTTGVAKGAMLTNKNIVSNMLQIYHWMKNDLKEGQEIIATPLPLYHIFSLTVNCLGFMHMGAKNVLITNPRDIPGFIKIIKNSYITVMSGVNTLFVALMNHEDFKTLDFSNHKITVAGGMALQKAVAERWERETKSKIVEGFGLTETSPVLTCNPIDGNDQKGSIGMPLPSTEVKVVNDDGEDLPVGEAGEIIARGPQVMKGYWQRPEETEKVMFGEWFRTGDIGVMQEDGFFRIVDRKKDMILVSGFNVYPNEIEDVLVTHEGIVEAAAVGVPDERSGEAIKVFIVKKDQNLTAEDVIAHCKKSLTGYKIPRHVEFRDDLPKSNVGKILRKDLRQADANA
ncbi:MAG: long-chain-fatty-acid--CoA ligase, partial [Bdellovibrionaceae bacterium]|nr:long-chain-fatty-acid--CoA ligase [Pseudobdellovibrionaceae bacterium]